MGMNDDYYPPGEGRRSSRPPPPEYHDDYDQRGPPGPPPPPPPGPPPRRMRTGEMIKPRVAGILVLLGVLIFFVGAILVQAVTLLESPEYEDFEDDDDPSESYDKAQEEHEDTQRSLLGSGRILNWVGAMIIALPLYVIGLSSDKIDWKIRASMLSAGTALVIATMIVTMFSTFSIG